MKRNIELIRYKHHGDDLVLFDLVNVTAAEDSVGSKGRRRKKSKDEDCRVIQYLNKADPQLKDLFESLKTMLLNLGDDVQMKFVKWYVVFRRMQNFACVEIHLNEKKMVVFVKVDPKSVTLENGFTRNMSNIGHYGTNDLEITIKSKKDLERAQKLIVKSYDAS